MNNDMARNTRIERNEDAELTQQTSRKYVCIDGYWIEDICEACDLNMYDCKCDEGENMSTETNPDPYQIEHTALGRKMLGGA